MDFSREEDERVFIYIIIRPCNVYAHENISLFNIKKNTLFIHFLIFIQESVRSKVYVAMDFSGEEGGRVLDNPKDIRNCDKTGPANKDGYVPFK